MKKTFFILVMLGLFIYFNLNGQTNKKDIKAINEWTENYMAGIKTADIERLLSHESDDVCYLPPNQPIVQGKDAARKWLQTYFENISPEEKITLQQVEIIGDYAYARGSYTYFGKMKKSGEEIKDSGKFIDIFKRQPNGDWKCTHAIWNSDNR